MCSLAHRALVLSTLYTEFCVVLWRARALRVRVLVGIECGTVTHVRSIGERDVCVEFLCIARCRSSEMDCGLSSRSKCGSEGRNVADCPRKSSSRTCHQ